MENGDIFFIEADKSDPRLVQTATKATHLDCTIDTAFAALDNGLDSHDILVVGGQMSSGGVYLVLSLPSFTILANKISWKLNPSQFLRKHN